MFTISATRCGVSSRKTPTVRVSCGSRRMMSRAWAGCTCRDDGANTNPTASAPMATANRASSSFVMPQIFTNMEPNGTGRHDDSGDNSCAIAPWMSPTCEGDGEWGPRSAVDEAIVQVVVVGGEVEVTVARVVEEDHPLLTCLFGREGLVDGSAHGVGSLGR